MGIEKIQVFVQTHRSNVSRNLCVLTSTHILGHLYGYICYNIMINSLSILFFETLYGLLSKTRISLVRWGCGVYCFAEYCIFRECVTSSTYARFAQYRVIDVDTIEYLEMAERLFLIFRQQGDAWSM